ncbi:MAG TPA: NADH-quinone oxidoreductase subunit J [Vicinamibacteria bacterium]|nr:NADH-quinone oxidoreductase subunit J [Vicinamibacteria bacterium]
MAGIDRLLQLVVSEPFLFYVFSATAVASALGVILQRNPIHSAFALIVTLCSLSAIYGLLGSPFIAALQVIVYAGAIMVLFLFVLMLLNVRKEEPAGGRATRTAAVLLALVLAAQLGAALAGAGATPAAGFDASTASFARVLFGARFVYVFEATSILIVAALVGAILVAKKDP